MASKRLQKAEIEVGEMTVDRGVMKRAMTGGDEWDFSKDWPDALRLRVWLLPRPRRPGKRGRSLPNLGCCYLCDAVGVPKKKRSGPVREVSAGRCRPQKS